MIRRPPPPGMRWVDGAVTAPRGFSAGSARAGIKTSGDDIAVVLSEEPATSAALFTRNVVQAAPVVVSRAHAASGRLRAIVANSGCANCCTGPQGEQDAREMAAIAADRLGMAPEAVLVASTGLIGSFLPMDRVRAGIASAAAALSRTGGPAVARAIMTTDTRPKEAAIELEIDGQPVRIGGIAKGVGMIQPNVATMFAFLTTDAALDPGAADSSLRAACATTFNCLTVDGDTSTNDTVVLLSNGSGRDPLRPDTAAFGQFQAALDAVCADLTRQIARDGEGATKLIEVHVRGAGELHEARAIARTVANSNLFKTAMFGNDPNWGRVLMAAGNAGVQFDLSRVRVTLCGTVVFEYGVPARFDASRVSDALGSEAVDIEIDLGDGPATATAFTCDFSYDYVKINAEYST